MPCVTFWEDANFGGNSEKNCDSMIQWTEQKDWNDHSSAKFDPYSIAWLRYVSNGGTKQDNCFVNVSDGTTSNVQRCYDNGNVSESVNMNNLSNVARIGYGGNWNDDVEWVWVEGIPTHKEVCIDETPTHKWVGKAAYNCPNWYANNKNLVKSNCNDKYPWKKNKPYCKWLENVDPGAIHDIKATHCSQGSNIKSDLCKDWMNEQGAPKAQYHTAWWNYCRNNNNYRNEECLNYIRNNPKSTYRLQFDNLWNSYCTGSGVNDAKCTCFDSDPKFAGQAFCFKPTCTNTGYRTKNMEETECANICQSIISGEAGNNATLHDLNVQQQCDQYGLNVRPPPTPGAPTPPPPGKKNQETEDQNGPPPPEQPGPVKQTFNYFLSFFNKVVLLILGVFLLSLSGFLYFTARGFGITIVLAIVAIVFIILGLLSKK